MSKFKEGDRVQLEGTITGIRTDGLLMVRMDNQAMNTLVHSEDIVPVISKDMRIFIFVGIKEGERELGDSVTIEGNALQQRTCAQMAEDLVERLMVEFGLGIADTCKDDGRVPPRPLDSTGPGHTKV